jgi:four helix bundle protein
MLVELVELVELFTYFARGSLCETITWIKKATCRGLIDEAFSKELLSELENISYKLNYYIKGLNEAQSKFPVKNPSKT